MKHIKIAIVALKKGDKYIMHHRGGKDEERGALGLTGFLGGLIDEGESGLEAARRELSEETNLDLPLNSFKALGKVKVLSDFDRQAVQVVAEVFKIEVPKTMEVKLNLEHEEQDMIDDKIVLANRSQVDKYIKEDKITPATRAAFKELL